MSKQNIMPQGKIYENSIDLVMHNSMMPYSEHVILERALPRVEDGLKPVQRRILFTMKELGITPEKPYKKSARIVGDCLGKYHPHGDSSVYDAMVRMAQDFNMSATLVSGHGNFGSIDGDSAAAMRYTEARLAPLAMEMLRDLDKDTVEWSLNFDDTLKEPQTLPSRYPNLLVNGASGIAVGLATNIPPHNITEVIDGVVAYIDKPKISLDEMMQIIKGPDFPTGCEIIPGEGLREAYANGKGKIIMRAKFHLEEAEYGKTNIVITQLPYQVNKANMLKKILNLRNMKKGVLMGISNIVDESDRNGMRAVITVAKTGNVKEIIKQLFKSTELESAFNINMVAIAKGRPKQLGLLDIIDYYVDYQREVILRRSIFDYNLAKDRAHILEGLIIALHNIDEVIAIIKKSKSVAEARQNLKHRFDLSEKQAQAILDMKLAKLTKLEVNKIEQELSDLKKLMAKLSAIIKSKKKQMAVVREEILSIRKAYKTDRRSDINGKIDALNHIKISKPKEESAPKGKLVLTYDHKLKLVSSRSYSLAPKDAVNLEKDSLVLETLTTEDKYNYFAITNLGNMARLDLKDIPIKPYKESGVDLVKIEDKAEVGEFIVKLLKINDKQMDKEIYIFTKKGMIKKSKFSDLILKKSFGDIINLKEDEIINAEFVSKDKTIFMATENGQAINAETSEIPTQGRKAGGVKGINLSKDDKLKFVTQIDDEGEVILFTDKGYAKKVLACEIEVTKRYRKGVKMLEFGKNNGKNIIYYNYVKQPYNLTLIMENYLEKMLVLNTEQLKILSRTHKGKQIIPKGSTLTEIIKHIE